MSTNLPNFFIVGAPKCGTTTVWHYLSRHPDIFLSRVKEPHHFCPDLSVPWSIGNRSEYFALFADVEQERVVGEASATYLYSKQAAQHIHEFMPNAKILVCLRNPVEMMYSLHSQYVYSLIETERDFAKAIELESERRREAGSPLLLYRDAAKYSGQIKRYTQIFAPENIHFLLFDDLVDSLHQVLEELFNFLGVDPAITIFPNGRAVNPNTTWKSLALARANVRFFGASPRYRWRWAMYGRLARWNSRVEPRPVMDDELYNRLLDGFLADIDTTEALIGRDLSFWKEAR